MLFLNPGGPGGSGVDLILGGSAEAIMNTVGGKYGLFSWDPRGVGDTRPHADCFATGTEESAFWEGIIPRPGLEVPENFTDPRDPQVFYDQVPEVDDLLHDLGQFLLAYRPDTFQYLGSAAGVRSDRFARLLGRDCREFSHGTRGRYWTHKCVSNEYGQCSQTASGA
ncbi:hypothetical protein FRC08_005512 [Ceratobasidium sp. 394]|nr:hypothetical protein FRC08_005512 [Ceratobasidium sp. 394]